MSTSQPLSTQLVDPPTVPAPQSKEWDLVELPPLIDFADLFDIIKRRIKLLIAIPFLLVALCIVWLYFIATPFYKSTAMVFIDPKFDNILQNENVNSIASDLDSLNSLEKAIVSDTMILRVVDKLNLRDEPGFLPKSLRKYHEKGKPISGSRLLADIRKKRFSASLIRPTRLIELTAYDQDPERAALIARTFVEEFELFLGERKQSEAGKSESELRAQADEAFTRALDAEKQLEEFRKKYPTITVEQDHNLFAERLTRAGEELNTVSSRVLDLQSQVETLAEVDPAEDPVKVINIGKFSDLDHVSNLLDQRTTTRAALAAVAENFTESHPRYRDAYLRALETENQLKELATDLKASVIASYEASTVNRDLLETQVAALQTKLSEVKQASSEFRAIQQRVETEWAVHQSLQQKLGESSLATQETTSITTLMSDPIVAHKPAKPSKPLFVLAAGFLGGMISLGLVGLELVRGRAITGGDQLERKVRAPVAAEVPAELSHKTDAELIAEMNKVLLSIGHRNSRFFHLSSVRESPGGIRVAACLASASAYYGHRTLLISVVPGGEPGALVNLSPLKSSAHLHTLSIPTSFLIAPRNSWELLTPHTEGYDRVVIESTALSQESQFPAFVASHSESNLLLVDRSNDNTDEIERAIALLSRNSPSAISLILQG